MSSTPRAKALTLLEMMIVAGVVVVLAALHQPCGLSPQRAKEAVLKTNLRTMRQVIALYQQEEGHYPETLDDLVTAGFLRGVPIDPMIGSATWESIVFDPCVEPATVGVRSSSPGTALDGTLYRRW